jgi:hypothetical protein
MHLDLRLGFRKEMSLERQKGIRVSGAQHPERILYSMPMDCWMAIPRGFDLGIGSEKPMDWRLEKKTDSYSGIPMD